MYIYVYLLIILYFYLAYYILRQKACFFVGHKACSSTLEPTEQVVNLAYKSYQWLLVGVEFMHSAFIKSLSSS